MQPLALAAVGCLGLISGREAFFSSFLVTFVFLASLSLGALIFVMINHVVGSTWSVVVRRIAEHLMMNLGYLAVLAIPLLLGIHDLYHWSHADAVAGDELLRGKYPYLNTPFFILRTVAYFSAWMFLATVLYRHSIAQDQDASYEHTLSMRRISAPGIAIYALTQTFAAFDWIMSVDPHWYSTIFGVYFFAGSFLGIHAAIVIAVMLLRRRGHLRTTVTVEHDHDLGKFIFAFVVFWTYIAFSQYMLIWYANIPEETVWFKHRWEGSWKWASLLLVFGHFILPFLFLMSRYMKRNARVLFAGAVWMMAMHYVDIYWLIKPAFSHGGIHVTIADVTTLVGFGGAYIVIFRRRLSLHPLVPVNDPDLSESIAFENH